METHSPERFFAVDLMSYISSISSIPYAPTGYLCRAGLYVDTPFRKNIRKAVAFLMGELEEKSIFLCNEDFHSVPVETHRYFVLIRSMSVRLQMREFSCYSFLAYCTLVCMIAVLLQKRGVDDAPNIAVEVITQTVGDYKKLGLFPHGTWDKLEEFAAEIEKSDQVPDAFIFGDSENDVLAVLPFKMPT